MASRRSADQGTAERALGRMADADPELAARLLLQSLPAAAAPLPADLSYRLEIAELGAWRVSPNGGAAEVTEVATGAELNGDAFAIETDAPTLARIAGGASAVSALLARRLRLRGKRRKAIALRKLASDAGPRELAKLGLPVDPDLLYRSLPYAIEPEWTRGHRFTILYQLSATMVVPGWSPSTTAKSGRPGAGRGGRIGRPARGETWMKLLSGELTPSESRRLGLTELEGPVYPVTLFGRWIDRAEGVDGPELEREQRQRRKQASRAGTWGSYATRASAHPGDPGETTPARRRGGLMSYQELYALWERQNWRAARARLLG